MHLFVYVCIRRGHQPTVVSMVFVRVDGALTTDTPKFKWKKIHEAAIAFIHYLDVDIQP